MVNRTVVRVEPGHLIVGLVCVGESKSTPLFLSTSFLAVQTEQALTMFLLSTRLTDRSAIPFVSGGVEFSGFQSNVSHATKNSSEFSV